MCAVETEQLLLDDKHSLCVFNEARRSRSYETR